MILQLALDRLDRDACFDLLAQTNPNIDWIEVGTGVIKEYGMAIVREIREKYPNHRIVADMKTCDAGEHEAKQAFEAGADIVTVMAFAADATIAGMLNVAKSVDKEVMVDLLNITDHDRVSELKRLGVKLVSLHIGKDMQLEKGLSVSAFDIVKDAGLTVSVAGGINASTLPEIVMQRPDIVIVGSAITGADSPVEESRKLKGMLT